jgi:hypothetical protein
MGWEWREQNRAKVLAHLQQGNYEAIVTSKVSGGSAALKKAVSSRF